MWAPKMSTKGQRGDQRTKDKGRTNLSSLSLSLSCRVRIYSQFFFQEEKKTQNHPSEEGAENPPSFAFLSVFALSRWWCCFIRAREHAEESEHPPKKEEKQTNEQRTEAQKISKKCQRGIFQRAKRGRLLGDWRRLFTKNLREEENTKRLLLLR